MQILWMVRTLFQVHSSSIIVHLNTNSERTFERKVDSKSFEDEKPRPPLGNLNLHTKGKHSEEAAVAAAAASADSSMLGGLCDDPSARHSSNILASARLMEDYLKEGKLNPKLEPTQKGFLQVFAACIIEDDLPFTTGESSGLARLFEYTWSKFMLPSDTTVRNAVAKIFIDLHGELVKELAVRR